MFASKTSKERTIETKPHIEIAACQYLYLSASTSYKMSRDKRHRQTAKPLIYKAWWYYEYPHFSQDFT